MAKLNKQITKQKIETKTFLPEGIAKLKKLTLAHMLWENQFYLDGKSAHDQLVETVKNEVSPEDAASVALLARTEYKLRHVPLAILRVLAKEGTLKAQMLTDVIQRPDEMAEFLSLYWKDGKCPVSAQVKKGLAAAFSKFNEYQFAKHDYNKSAISLRDVMFLSHPRPVDVQQEALFSKIANNALKTPDTWEVALSGGADKAEVFTRLMQQKKLGSSAFLRNIRNMVQSGVSFELMNEYAKVVNTDRELPFRFITAYKHVPKEMHAALQMMMLRCMMGMDRLDGHTLLLVDVSGSMYARPIAAKSEMLRSDAAAALAILAREICTKATIATFSNNLVVLGDSRGFDLAEDIHKSQDHGGTNFYTAMLKVKNLATKFDRIIVFTDGEATDMQDYRAGNVAKRNYILNVAAYNNALNMGANCLEIAGFSEQSLRYITEHEKLL